MGDLVNPHVVIPEQMRSMDPDLHLTTPGLLPVYPFEVTPEQVGIYLSKAPVEER